MASLRAALALTLQASAVPYGYTLTIWSTGAVLIAALGAPPVSGVMSFTAGAVSAYWLLSALSDKDFDHAPPSRQEYRSLGRLHWLPITFSIGLAALFARVAHWWAWPVTSFAATSIYVLAASSHLALIGRTRDELKR
jgi:hypothetical protein